MKTRIEDIITESIKSGKISSNEGTGILAAVLFVGDLLVENEDAGYVFKTRYGTFNVENVLGLIKE